MLECKLIYVEDFIGSYTYTYILQLDALLLWSCIKAILGTYLALGVMSM